jgi:hypothetical protein
MNEEGRGRNKREKPTSTVKMKRSGFSRICTISGAPSCSALFTHSCMKEDRKKKGKFDTKKMVRGENQRGQTMQYMHLVGSSMLTWLASAL